MQEVCCQLGGQKSSTRKKGPENQAPFSVSVAALVDVVCKRIASEVDLNSNRPKRPSAGVVRFALDDRLI